MIETIQEHLIKLITGILRSEQDLEYKTETIEALLGRYKIEVENLQELIENIDIKQPITAFDEYINEIANKTLEDNLKPKGN